MSGSQLALLGGPFGAGAAGDPNWQNVALLSGTTTTNAGQNNTFIDSSSNNFTITRNGNTTQGTFTPFSAPNGYWGNYFDGDGDYLTVPGNTAFDLGSGNFTLEMWVNPTSLPASRYIRLCQIGGDSNDYFLLQYDTSSQLMFFGMGGGGAATQIINASYSLPVGVFTHIAIVREGTGSNQVKFYANGSLVAQGTYAGSMASGGAVWIAGINWASTTTYNLPGYVSNFRLVKGTAVYTSNFTPSTTPLTSISGTSLLTCQSNRFVDNSPNAFAITAANNTAVVPFAPFGNTSMYSTTSVGGSGYFDGNGDYLSVPNNTALNLSSGDWTIEFWTYVPSGVTSTIFLNKDGVYGSKQPQYDIELNSSRLYARIGDSSGAGTFAVIWPATTFPYNQWVHVEFVKSGSTIYLFQNGVSMGTASTIAMVDSGNPLYIGTESGSPTTMNGYISGLRILKGTAAHTSGFTPPTAPPTAITNTSLLLNYTNAGIYDQAAKNDMETVGNAQVSTSVFKYGTSSAYFDGTGDRLFVANSSPNLSLANSEYTVEMWVYPNSFSGTPYVVSSGSTGGTYWAMYFTTGGALGWGGNTGANQFTAGTVSTGTWTHIAVSQNGSSAKWYINGNNVLTKTATDINNANWVATNQLSIGSNFGSNDFNGYISDLRITKGLGRYPYNFTPPTTSLPNFYQAQTLTADPYFDYTTLLLPGNGTNGAQNNTFLDSSTNAFSITRNGNTTQGTFSPFSQTGWSNYFDGSGDWLTVADNAALDLGSGALTIEFWVNPSRLGQAQTIVSNWQGVSNGYTVGITSGNVIRVNLSGDGVDITGSVTLSVGQWYHVAVSGASNSYKLFVNGTQDGSTYTGTPSADGSTLFIGADPYLGGSEELQGYISNLRIVKGTAVYTANFTPPTAALTAITNTSLLTCQSNRFVDNSTNAFTITRVGNTSVQAFSPFAPTAAYSAATNGGSGYFDGSGDYLNFTDTSNDLDIGGTVASIEFWAYPADTAATRIIFNKGGGNSGTAWSTSDGLEWTFVYVSGGDFYFQYNNAGNVGSIATTITANTWTHFAVATDGSNNIALFKNGSRVGTATNAITKPTTRTAVRIGTDWTSQSFVGYVSGIRVIKGTGAYDPTQTTITIPTAPPTAVTNTKFLANFTNAGITDATAKNDLETVGNAQISNGAAKFGSTSMYFDGSGDYLQLVNSPILSLDGDFTVEGWIYINAYTAGSATFFQLGSSTGALLIYVSSSDGNIKTAGTFTLTGGNIGTGTWKHFALVRYGTGTNNVTFYVNGIASGQTTNTSSLYGNASNGLRIGAEYPSGYYLDGYLQDLRITKGIARYTQNFTPPTAAFQLL